MNKKIIFGMILLLLIVLVGSGFSNGLNEKKVDSQVIRALSNGKKVKVVVQEKDKWYADELTEREIKKVSAQEDVEQIVYNYEIVPLMDDVVELVNASLVWNSRVNGINLTGQGQSVCVIDTGANYSHTDLGGCIGGGCKVLGGHDFGNDDDEPLDYHGHGTHVAGIVGGNGKINGTARGVNLVIIKVFTDAGAGESSDMVSAIEWCVNNASLYNISVISMSLGLSSGGETVLRDNYCDSEYVALSNAINSAVAQNISVVAAAGNENNYTHIGMPACMENATPISWGTKDYELNSEGNRNNMTQLFAPGTDVTSTSKTGDYEERSGSSMATPAVAGLIAIINQYLEYSEKTNTTHEIESLLNDTGIPVFDSETNITFSHVDINAALLELDEEAPDVKLTSPVDGASSINSSYTFICNVSDIFLNNITFYLWNSTQDIINQSNFSSAQDYYNLEIEIVNLSSDNYEWNCLAKDVNGNTAFASSNYSLNVDSVSTNLIIPENNSYKNTDGINFTCSSETNVGQLSNVSFYLWNSTEQVYNETKNIYGLSNSSVFNYSFSQNGEYEWNCLSRNNKSTEKFASSNYSLTYDSINPSITALSPDDSSSYTGSQTLTLSYNVSDNSDISNCSLYLGGSIDETNSSINNQSQTHSFIQEFSSAGTYTWQIKCKDMAGNQGESDSRTITINIQASSGTSSSSSSSSTTTTNTSTTTTTITNSGSVDLSQTRTALIGKGGVLEFDNSGSKHTLKVESINSNLVKIIVKSNPIEIILKKGEEKKLSLDKEGYYDVLVKFEGQVGIYAKIIIKSIDEQIPGFDSDSNETTEEIVEENVNIAKKIIKESAELLGEAFGQISSNKGVITKLVLFITATFVAIALYRRFVEKKNL